METNNAKESFVIVKSLGSKKCLFYKLGRLIHLETVSKKLNSISLVLVEKMTTASCDLKTGQKLLHRFLIKTPRWGVSAFHSFLDIAISRPRVIIIIHMNSRRDPFKT